ncbi:hypothetical protein GCM10027341_26210 [Spirosoma knui]
MKKDNLERFVRDNREAFDDKEPPGNLWRNIEAELTKQQSGSAGLDKASPFQQVHRNHQQLGRRQIGWPSLDWRVAASVAVLLLAGSFFYMNYQYGVTQQPTIVAASPIYAKEVVQYTRLIDTKRAELKQMTEDNPQLYKEFATDLNRLERSYQSLKADLPKNPNQEMLIQAMIQNLQIQIDLLNEQLRVIQRIKRQTNENPV